MSTFTKELEPLMLIITELRKTIVELTQRLARYEAASALTETETATTDTAAATVANDSADSLTNLPIDGNGAGNGTTPRSIFQVNFATGVQFGTEQVGSYRAAIDKENGGAYGGTASRLDPANATGSTTQTGSRSNTSSDQNRGRNTYDPRKDRNNVAYYRQGPYQGRDQPPVQQDQTLRNKRQLPPLGRASKTVVDSESSSSNTTGNPSKTDVLDDDSAGWSIAAGPRRRILQRSPTAPSIVTPIIMRHRRSLNRDKMVGSADPWEDDGDGENDSEDLMQVDEVPNDQAPAPAHAKQMGEKSRFITPRPDGSMRDVLTIECPKMNGVAFKGSITYTEAREKIFHELLGLPRELLHSLKMSYTKCRTITFKLTEQINTDDLFNLENFKLERNYVVGTEIKTDEIECRIMGIRKPRTAPEIPRPQFDGSDADIQWVEISGCQYSIDPAELVSWLELYGQVLSSITEMIHPEADINDKIGNGTYIVKMKLNTPIPQYLPISGRKVRIYYNGIRRVCTNCYGFHAKQRCRNKKIQWIAQVKNFMKSNPGINPLWYGKWWHIIHPVSESQNKTPNNPNNQTYAQSYTHNQRREQSRTRSNSRHRTRLSRQHHEQNHQDAGTSRDWSMNGSKDRSRSANQSDYQTIAAQEYRDYVDQQIQRLSKENTNRMNTISYEVETYITKGLSRSEATAYVESLKTQDKLRQRMSNQNQTQNGGQI